MTICRVEAVARHTGDDRGRLCRYSAHRGLKPGSAACAAAALRVRRVAGGQVRLTRERPAGDRRRRGSGRGGRAPPWQRPGGRRGRRPRRRTRDGCAAATRRCSGRGGRAGGAAARSGQRGDRAARPWRWPAGSRPAVAPWSTARRTPGRAAGTAVHTAPARSASGTVPSAVSRARRATGKAGHRAPSAPPPHVPPAAAMESTGLVRLPDPVPHSPAPSPVQIPAAPHRVASCARTCRAPGARLD